MTIIDEDRDLSDEGILKEADVALFEVSPTYYILPLSCLSYPRMYKISLCFSHFLWKRAGRFSFSVYLCLSLSLCFYFSLFLSIASSLFLPFHLSHYHKQHHFILTVPHIHSLLSRRSRRVLNCVVCLYY